MAGLGARHRREIADEALVRRLFQEHGNAMLAYATRLTGDRGVAEGVFQEALVRAWRDPDGMANGKCWTRKWLLCVVDELVRDPQDKARGKATTRAAERVTARSESLKASGYEAHCESGELAARWADLPVLRVSVPKARTYRTWRLTGATRRRWP